MEGVRATYGLLFVYEKEGLPDYVRSCWGNGLASNRLNGPSGSSMYDSLRLPFSEPFSFDDGK